MTDLSQLVHPDDLPRLQQELNAVLKQYNVLADRGSDKSRIFQGGGLVYRILDEDGKPVGVPIKASDFYNKPTLKFLEEKGLLFRAHGGATLHNPYTIDRPVNEKLAEFFEEMIERRKLDLLMRARQRAAGRRGG